MSEHETDEEKAQRIEAAKQRQRDAEQRHEQEHERSQELWGEDPPPLEPMGGP